MGYHEQDEEGLGVTGARLYRAPYALLGALPGAAGQKSWVRVCSP
jgi:hypothetical protein